MKIVIDPVPLVLGIYAYVGEVLTRTAQKREADSAESLGRRYSRQQAQADRDVQKMVRALHTDVKTADKLLKKTSDVELVLLGRGEEPAPRAYVLLKLREVQPLLLSIRDAARGAGESPETIAALDQAAVRFNAGPGDYLTFGFDAWQG